MDSTAASGLSSSGVIEEFGGNTILPLDGNLRAWCVETGVVDVFAVHSNRSTEASRRRFIRRFGEGSTLFSFAQPADRYRLVAVPAGRARLRRFDGAFLEGCVHEDESADLLASAVDRWIEEMAAGVFDVIPPKQHLEPPQDETILMEGGTPLRSTRGVLWLSLDEGSCCIIGRPELRASSTSARCVPIGYRIWIEPDGICRLRCRRTIGRIMDGRFREDLETFHALILRAVAWAEAERRRTEERRIRLKTETDRKVFAGAIGRLANVMSKESPADSSEDDMLLKACRIVGRAARIDVRAPLETNSEESRGNLARIQRASRFRTRRVALRGRWWRCDAGPLLAVQLAEDGAIRTPVALVPCSKERYRLIDPCSGESRAVDDEVAERLDPFAFAFYRPFHRRAVKAWEVFRFGAEGCRGDFLMILLMGAAGGVLGLVPPIFMGIIFNEIIPGADRLQLAHLVAALLVSALAATLFQFVRGLAVLRIESRMEACVQSAVWDRLLDLPATFFRRFAAGDLAVRASGISEMRRLLSGATISSILSGMFSLLNLVLLFYYDPILAVCACGLTFAALATMLSAGYVQLKYQRQVAAAQSRLSGQVLQYITGITKLRVAGAEAKSYGRWASGFAEQRRLQFKARRIGNGLTTFNATFSVLSMMVIFSTMMARDGGVMATGDFIAFNGAYGAFTANMLGMTGAFMAILLSVPIYEQAEPILKTLPEINETKTDPGPLTGDIEISHVSFRYDSTSGLVLDDVSLRASSGEFIAFVGPSGSGKSSTLRLLLGFEQPENGSIYVDGRDLAGLDIQAVRRQIGVVLQNGSVMTGDIFSNISGSTPATMDDAWNAARMAGLEADIRRMPMGMHTVISEGGTTLSGGQRQRLMIARAIVRRPRILFFDEATSALDNRTQAVVSSSLERLQATRIVVAHRLSTIMNADRIYVFDRGRVAQQGTYASLLKEGGLFGELVRRQIA